MTQILYATGVLAVLGVLFGAILTFAGKKFEVEVDPRVTAVRDCLGGANCGACGYAGCDAYAEAVVSGEARPDMCPPGGNDAAQAIAEVMGLNASNIERQVARVMCQGTIGIANDRYTYDGYHSCRVAAGIAGGPKECEFSCIGLGDCIAHCAFGALSMRGGIAYVDEQMCKACGACVGVCPRSVLKMVPVTSTVTVRCNNQDVAKNARAACMRACIACGRCTKTCKEGAITVENNVARIDPEKCTHCGDCVKVCPCKCITLQ